MKSTILISFASIFLVILTLNIGSALVVEADYITIFPGEEGKVNIEIENNHDFDIEDVSMQILLFSFLPDGTPTSLPFTIVGSSEKNIDDINDDDSEDVSFIIRANNAIIPGDYNIPYRVKYFEEGENDEFEVQGTFGIRVSAKTELDFSVEAKGEETESAIVGQEGKISLEIINQGLGEIKSASVQVFPQGFELLSKDKIFVGTIDADDTDIATFDVIFEQKSAVLKATITYKDFDNNEQTEIISLPFKAYTREEALELGIISKSNTTLYIGIIVVLIIIWFIWRRVRKVRRNKKK